MRGNILEQVHFFFKRLQATVVCVVALPCVLCLLATGHVVTVVIRLLGI